MRLDKIKRINSEKQYYKALRRKRLAAFLLIFWLYAGLVIVDRAGSEITGYPEHLSPGIVRIDKERIAVSFFGKEARINTAAIAGEITAMKEITASMAHNIAGLAKDRSPKREIEDIQVLLPGKTL